MNSRNAGAIGEGKAAEFLVTHGYTVLAKNFHCRTGEIDIIAKNSDELVFVEVKTWKTFGMEDLEYAINRTKRRRIISSSKKYILDNPEYAGFQCRYDVILVQERDDRITHINNAFSEV